MSKRKQKTTAHLTRIVRNMRMIPEEIGEGDKVRLNVTRIKSRKGYAKLTEAYKAFVDVSKDEVFTAHVEMKNMVSFVEEPRWLFWSGDLVKVTPGEA